ncbi:hypothetical protein [Oceanirhabdus seepicola]|uniref:Uncharacterized protein n=1 Tax=Oceanirhabdus seepicola TaxID=2828781 RepID=A0A9J6PA75_9CLOT|nr:hypothetical protein [Oceanirhabdus seepicola]MCM1992152.1 hypothetical protein [Oceanirhabdus seepicola]
MKKCRYCDFENEDISKVCASCGKELDEKAELQGESVVTQEKNEQEQTKKGKSPLKYIGIAVAALLVLMIGAKFLIFNATPTEKLFAGMKKDSKKKEAHQKVNISFEVMNTNTMADLLNDLDIEFLAYAENKTGVKGSFQGNILLNDESILKSVVAIDGQKVFIELVDLYEKYFYIDGEEIQRQSGASQSVNTNILANREYIKNFKLESVDWKKYEKAIEEVLGENIKKVDGKINIKFNLSTAVTIIDELIKVAEEDEELKKAIYVEVKTLLEKIKEDDEVVDQMAKEEIEMTLEEYFKDEETFIDILNEGMIIFKQELDVVRPQLALMGAMVTIEADYDIDMFNNIKTAEYEITVPGATIKASVDNTVKVKMKKYDKEEAVNIMDLQDSEEVYAILEEILNNFSTNVTSNDELIKYIEENEILDKYFYGVESVDQLFEIFVQNIIGVY